MDTKNTVWTEKYRPNEFEDLVGGFKLEIQEALKNQASIQHLLLHSRTPGVGKTTLARIIARHLDADTLEINSADDRSIDTVRNKIIAFARTKSSNPNSRRIVILDEADGMTKLTQKALINSMETYASNALFILTCNNLTKIIDTLQSRCNIINFDNPAKKEILQYLIKLCNAENITYTEQGLNNIINDNYPSIRNCVIAIQKLVQQGKELNGESFKVRDEEFDNLWKLITNEKDWKTVADYVLTHDINIKQLNDYFWTQAVEESNKKIIQCTGMNESKFSYGADEKIIFITSLIDMVK